MPTPRRVPPAAPPLSSQEYEPAWCDSHVEEFFHVPKGTMRRARCSGKPPELANIPFLKLGHLVRYQPRDVRAAEGRMRVDPAKAERGS